MDVGMGMREQRRVLVTGGAGFIGAAISSSLVRAGHDVTILDNLERGALERLGSEKERVTFVSADIRDAGAVRAAVEGRDTIVHLAYINGTRHFYERPELVLDVGLRGMINLADALKETNVQDFFLASSSEVYQVPPEVPTDEFAPLCVPDPRNPRYSYGGGKIACELMALHWVRPLVERTVVFRPHNVYGYDMGFDHVIPELTRRAHGLSKGLPAKSVIQLPIKGDGSASRAFINIEDFCSAIMLLLEKGEDGNIYHVGTAEEVTIAHVAKAICHYLGHKVDLVQSEAPAGETPRRVPDISAMHALGFRPKIALEDGIKRYVRDYLADYATD